MTRLKGFCFCCLMVRFDVVYSSIHRIVTRDSRTFAINVPDMKLAYWVLRLATKHQMPVILQISERVLKHEGQYYVRALKQLADTVPVEVAIHLDHCKNIDLCHQALEWGLQSLLFDGSELPLADNLKFAKDLVAKALRFDAYVEGEIAAIPGNEDGCELEKSNQISVEDAISFAKETSVFSFAPFFGNFHGQYPRGYDGFDFEYLKKLSENINIPLVIHGGSGMTKLHASRLKGIGFGKLNISTDFKSALSNVMETDPFKANLEQEQNVSEVFERLVAIWRS